MTAHGDPTAGAGVRRADKGARTLHGPQRHVDGGVWVGREHAKGAVAA